MLFHLSYDMYALELGPILPVTPDSRAQTILEYMANSLNG